MVYKSKRYVRKRYNKPSYKPKTSVEVRNSSYPVAKTNGPVKGLYQGAASWVNSAYRGYSTAQKALKLGSLAMGMLNAEKKYFDIVPTSVSPGLPSGAYVITSLMAPITTGDGPNNRDGSQIRLKSLQIQMDMTQNSAATTATVCRWVLFLDNRVDVGTVPAYTDLYDNATVSNTFLNIADQWRRFKIIRSDEVILDSDDTRKTVSVYVPCSLPIRYNSTGDLVMNNIWLMLASTNGTSPPNVNYRYRVRFYDN